MPNSGPSSATCNRRVASPALTRISWLVPTPTLFPPPSAGRIRLPARSTSDAKSVLPDHSGGVRVILRGEEMVVPYNPRVEADHERSGVLSAGATRLARLVEEDEVLQVTVDQDGVVCLD